jgi:hypothetical protein
VTRGYLGPVASYPGTLTRDEATAILGFDPGDPNMLNTAPSTPMRIAHIDRELRTITFAFDDEPPK